MNAFKNYLHSLELAPKTIFSHLQNLSYFKAWAKENNRTGIEHITYTELIGYVQYLKAKNLNTSTINIRLGSLRKYFEHLKQEGIIEVNPARKLFIKGQTKSVIINPLTYTELEELHYHYTKPKEYYREEHHRTAHERNGIILGLMIWQGIHSGELGKMELDHVNLQQGTIYIPSTSRSNSRELKLEARQIIALHQYITSNNFIADQNGMLRLFTSHNHATFQRIVEQLKGINSQIRNAQHIRASVILHWLRMYDKRTVQHMLGFRCISSVETYEVQELTGLTDLLSKHHPFS